MKININYPKITANKVNDYAKETLNEFKSKVDKTWAEAHSAYKNYMHTDSVCDFWGSVSVLALVAWFAVGMISLIYSTLTVFIVASAIANLICAIHIVTAIIKINTRNKMNAQVNEALDFILKILDTYSIYPVLDENTCWRSLIREQIEMEEAYSDDLDAWKIVLWGQHVSYYERTINNIETLNEIGFDNILFKNIEILDDRGRDKYYGPYAILKENLNGYELNSYSLYLSAFKKTRNDAKDIIRTALTVKDEITIDLSYLDKWFDKCL